METRPLSLLALLEKQAAAHTDRLAHQLPDRDITYRRLWSRIERGSARLQGEWGVRSGDTVAYVGSGHPDAIVLYCALLRIGASLLPLESVPPVVAARLFERMNVSLAVHDDGVVVQGVPARRLDDLLAIWCHYDPTLAADEPERRALWLPLGDDQWRSTSIAELCAGLPAVPRSTCVNDRIFTEDMLRHVVLPSLAGAVRMQFAAAGPALRTGS